MGKFIESGITKKGAEAIFEYHTSDETAKIGSELSLSLSMVLK